MRQSLEMLSLAGGDLYARLRDRAGNNPFLRVRDRCGSSSDMAAPQNLADYIDHQIGMAFRRRDDRAIARAIAGYIDPAGYLRLDAADLAPLVQCDRATLLRILSVMRDFDPPGLFARDLADCLRLQLKQKDDYDVKIAQMLNHLPLVAEKKWRDLSARIGCREDEVRAMAGRLRRLDPKPAARYATCPVPPRIADLILSDDHDDTGALRLDIDNQSLPSVMADHTYAVRWSRRYPRDQKWVRDCLDEANDLVRALSRRCDTLLRVGKAMVDAQEAFFHRGRPYLRPLSAIRVAHVAGCHPSTVSRAIKDKYLSYRHDVFPLEMFFDRPAYPGATCTSGHVRDLIRDMIRSECGAPMSDRRICLELDKQNIPLRRRTVARYRQSMDIADSRNRPGNAPV